MILDAIIAAARRRADALGSLQGDGVVRRASFRDRIVGRERLSLIAEWKRRSPSRGPLALRFGLEDQVRAYTECGAAALSVLTEPDFFGGSLDDLRRAASVSDLPILCKDFVIDPRQVQAAAHHGASAVLLILRVLDDGLLHECLAACRDLAIDALLECHDEAELDRALAVEGALIGVNNRDLDTLALDRERAVRLLPRIPPGRVAIAESGYRDTRDVAPLAGLADAVLVGHALLLGTPAHAFDPGPERRR